jgi:diguanylate cyclase (GGDEF)-like protein
MDLGSSGLWDDPLRVAASLAHMVVRERDPDRARELILEQTGRLLDASLVRLFEPFPQAGLQYTRSWGEGHLPASAIAMERELLARAAEQNRSLLSTHYRLDRALRGLAERCRQDHVIVHLLLIRADQATHGAACVHWLNRERPTFEQRVGFYLYWDQIGIALATMHERALVQQELGRLHQLALRDDLTGLPNGRALNDELQRRLDEKASLTLLVIDFDGMRDANNQLGHQAGGDVLIRAVGTALPQLLAAHEFAARLHTAGDEFACITRTSDDEPAVERAAKLERGLASIEVPNTHRGLYRGASVGHATSLPDDTPATLIARASESMRRRKRERYNRTVGRR